MEIPIKYVRTGDDALAKMFHGFARSQLSLLERRQALGNKETVHRVNPYPGVSIKCISFHNHREVQIYVEPSPVVEEQIKKEMLEYLIVARGTGLNIYDNISTATFPFARIMLSEKIDYAQTTYEFVQVQPEIGRSGVHRFLQVRYVSGAKIASLCVYRDSPPSGDSSTIEHVVEVVGEANMPSLLLRKGSSAMVETKFMAAMSEDLGRLYVAYSVTYTTMPLAPTDIYYSVYRLPVDGEDQTQWVAEAVEVKILYDEEGYYYVDTSVDRDGNIGCFRASIDYDYYDEYNDNGYELKGFYPLIDGGESYWMERNVGLRRSRDFLSFSAVSESFVDHQRNQSITVAPKEKDKQEWDYTPVLADENTETEGIMNEFSCSGELGALCPSTSSVYTHGECSNVRHYTEGDHASWKALSVEFITLDGMRREGSGFASVSHVCPSGGNPPIASMSTGTNISVWDGSITFNTLQSCIFLHEDTSRAAGEYRYSTTANGAWVYPSGGTAYTWIAMPEWSGTYDNEWLVNQKNMIHPFEIDDIEGVANAFISHDQETGLTFAGVRLVENAPYGRWLIQVCGGPFGYSDWYDITDQVQAAFFGKCWFNINEGVIVERTDEQKANDFQSTFECIYFKRGSMEA